LSSLTLRSIPPRPPSPPLFPYTTLFRSEAWPPSSVTRATTRASSARSRISSWARRLSSQKAGDAISVSSAPSRASLVGRSKVPPKLVDTPGQLGDVALEVAQHYALPSASTAARGQVPAAPAVGTP